jgi:hypothetical protein
VIKSKEEIEVSMGEETAGSEGPPAMSDQERRARGKKQPQEERTDWILNLLSC